MKHFGRVSILISMYFPRRHVICELMKKEPSKFFHLIYARSVNVEAVRIRYGSKNLKRLHCQIVPGVKPLGFFAPLLSLDQVMNHKQYFL